MAGSSCWCRVELGVDDARLGAELDEQHGEWQVAAQRGFVQSGRAVAGVDVEPEIDE